MTRDEYLIQQENLIPVKIRQAVGAATLRGSGPGAVVMGAGAPFKLAHAEKVLGRRFNLAGAELNRVVDYLYDAIHDERRRQRISKDGPFAPERGGWMKSWMSN